MDFQVRNLGTPRGRKSQVNRVGTAGVFPMGVQLHSFWRINHPSPSPEIVGLMIFGIMKNHWFPLRFGLGLIKISEGGGGETVRGGRLTSHKYRTIYFRGPSRIFGLQFSSQEQWAVDPGLFAKNIGDDTGSSDTRIFNTPLWLCGGFKYFSFSPLPGEDSHFDYSNIFQVGWNHQLDKDCYESISIPWNVSQSSCCRCSTEEVKVTCFLGALVYDGTSCSPLDEKITWIRLVCMCIWCTLEVQRL